jgi:hypothetical protein
MERNGARPILSLMNISWSDLNNVQDAGDYPFRDGTISVTFAEVAIWKKNPDAQFRLMRKHPIQSAFKYVLGRQIEETLAADGAEFIYESSNGDSWCLTRDPATGAQAVMHRAEPLGEALGPRVFPDGLWVLFGEVTVVPALPVVVPFIDEPVALPVAAEPPAAGLPPAVAPPACASAKVPESANAVANAIVLIFMLVSLVSVQDKSP